VRRSRDMPVHAAGGSSSPVTASIMLRYLPAHWEPARAVRVCAVSSMECSSWLMHRAHVRRSVVRTHGSSSTDDTRRWTPDRLPSLPRPQWSAVHAAELAGAAQSLDDAAP
jgi:hypothetical protein